MRKLRPAARRVVSIAAAALAGAAATLAFATPAFAHHTNVIGEGRCAPEGGGWIIAWTITSFDPDGDSPTHYALQSASTTTDTGSGAGAYTGDLAGPFNPPGNFVGPGKTVDQPFTGTQTMDTSVEWAKLTVNAVWNNNNHSENNSEKVYQPKDCPAPPAEPKAEFTSNCDGTVTVKLFNESDGGDVTYSVTGSPDVTLIPGETKSVTVPGNVQIVVSHGQWHTEYTWKDPGNCLPVTGSSLGGVIGWGAGLIALGAGLVALFVLLRRRRARLSV